jgi:hypothetical protein
MQAARPGAACGCTKGTFGALGRATEAALSYIVMTHIPVQVADFERVSKEHEDTFMAVSAEGKAAGAIHHSFLEDSDGTLIVLDEWPSEEAFHTFFDGQQEIPGLMTAAGMSGPPSTTAYRILDTSDRF